MIAEPVRMRSRVGLAGPAHVALLTVGLLLVALITPDRGRAAADDPATGGEQERFLDWYKHNNAAKVPTAEAGTSTPEDMVRFLDWYKHNSAPKLPGSTDTPTAEDVARYLEWVKHNSTATSTQPDHSTANTEAEEVARYLDWFKRNGAPQALPIPPAPTTVPRDEIARFQEWYRRYGTPKPPNSIETPSPEDVACYLEWYKRNGAPSTSPLPEQAVASAPPTPDEVARYLEWYKRNGTPTPIRGPQTLPVVTAIDVRPITDNPGRLPAAQERLRPVPPPLPRPMANEIVQTAATGTDAVPSRLPPIIIDPPPVAPPAPPRPLPWEMPLPPLPTTTAGKTDGASSPAAPSPYQRPASYGSANCACGSANCLPNNPCCPNLDADTPIDRFLTGIYGCLCCPDPSYEPKWIPLADSAFFVESARPQSQVRLRWDSGLNVVDPDRAEYFWARADGKGVGPNPLASSSGLLGEKSVDYNDLLLYAEAAYGNFSGFIEAPYRWLQGDVTGSANGFGDMNFGGKALLFDTELLQITLEFRTYLPFGDPAKGLGTGHVSVEPGLLMGLKLGPATYFQGQLEEWIPIGGDPDYEGSLLEYHFSVNQLLWNPMPDMQLVGTAELNGWSFQSGEYTDPFTGAGQRAAGTTYLSMGPGLRLFIGDRIDFGLGMAFALTEQHWAEQLYQTEFRWRF